MSWPDYWAAAQLLSEERVGRLVREAQRREDAAFGKAITPEADE